MSTKTSIDHWRIAICDVPWVIYKCVHVYMIVCTCNAGMTSGRRSPIGMYHMAQEYAITVSVIPYHPKPMVQGCIDRAYAVGLV